MSRPFARDPAALDGAAVDVLVVGGGIYGAWCAYDAARRGLSVALVDAGDWGGGTSSASSKLVHGGLRYLEHFAFGLVRHALAERRVLARIAPHLVRPMNFVVPVWRGARVGPLRLAAGLTLYDLLAWGRQPVQRHKRYAPERLRARYPFLRAEGLRAGFRYGDCQDDDARVTLAVVRAAHRAGALVANHVAVTALPPGRAELVDRIGGRQMRLIARHTIAAVGPWITRLPGITAPRVRLVAGTHLVMPAMPDCRSAFLLTSPIDGRAFFAIPWYGRTLLGTTERAVDDPAEAVPTDAETAYLLESARAWLPGLGWTESDVIARFAGVRTLQDDGAASLNAATREFTVRALRDDLTAPIGGKFTTARRDAALVVDAVCRRLRHDARCTTHEAPLPGTPPGDLASFLDQATARLAAAGADRDAAACCALRHGADCDALLDLVARDPALARRIDPELPFIHAEAAHARAHEMAVRDEDVFRRRIPLAILSAAPPVSSR